MLYLLENRISCLSSWPVCPIIQINSSDEYGTKGGNWNSALLFFARKIMSEAIRRMYLEMNNMKIDSCYDTNLSYWDSGYLLRRGTSTWPNPCVRSLMAVGEKPIWGEGNLSKYLNLLKIKTLDFEPEVFLLNVLICIHLLSEL